MHEYCKLLWFFPMFALGQASLFELCLSLGQGAFFCKTMSQSVFNKSSDDLHRICSLNGNSNESSDDILEQFSSQEQALQCAIADTERSALV